MLKGQDIELQKGVQVDAELVMSENATIDELRQMEPQNRTRRLLEIDANETLNPTEDGVELNEGYTYNIDGGLPEVADALAKLAIEIDKDKTQGENAGAGFIMLIGQFYNKLKSE